MDTKIKNLLGWLSAVLVLIVIVFMGVEVKNRLTTSIDLSKTRSVTMSAEGKVTAKPDIANINFSVVTQGKEAAKVQAENDKKMTEVIDYLKSQGIKEDDIKTSNYNLYPQYDYNARSDGSSQPPAIIGYTLNQSVSVKVWELEKVPSLVGNLTSKGVNQIDNVAYSIDDPDKLKAEARAEAVNKAKDKAAELADKLGVKLGRVINFSEGSSYLPEPYYYDKAMSTGMGGGGSSPVQPGSQDVTVSVTLTFELR